MNPDVDKLIPAIVSYVGEHSGYVTKTKLLKLLYLFDVEYFRAHRKTFTGFAWKFFHLGPWTAEYEPVLEGLIAQNVLAESQSSRLDFDTRFYSSPKRVDLGAAIPNLRDEVLLKSVLKRWGNCNTGEILDYVYFRTEPMEFGIRNELLDFGHILEQSPAPYTRPSSGKSPNEIKALRQRFREQLQTRELAGQQRPAFTHPRYDDEFFEAMARLEESQR